MSDGGPAFPLQHNMFRKYEAHEGMSLRDWFAGQALAAMGDAGDYADGEWNPDQIAHECYRTADAMLKARETT